MPFTNKLLAEADEKRGQSPRPEERGREASGLYSPAGSPPREEARAFFGPKTRCR